MDTIRIKIFSKSSPKNTIKRWLELELHAYLGIPLFYRSGMTEFKGRSYRFMVMERLCCVLSHSVLSDPLQPHGLYPPRLLCPWDSPGKNTGVGSHALLQGKWTHRRSQTKMVL